jgi:hypothetical protein
MGVRILHTADWQLGKPFNNIPGDAGAVLREARFAAVRRIAALAVEHEVDVVLVAGDVFDSNHVGDATIHRCLQAMEGFRGPWVLLPGNHDALLAECVWGRLERLGRPAQVIVADRPEAISLLEGRLVVLPAPLMARRTFDDLTAWMDTAASPAGCLRVGLAHGAIPDRLPGACDAANPIAPDRAERARLDHLALGDWHGTLEIAPRSWYAGTPEPDRFPANDPGNVLLVELPGAGEAARVTRLCTATFTWRSLTVSLRGATHPGEPAVAIEAALAGVGPPERTLVALHLEGTVGLADRLLIEGVLDRWAARLRHLRVDDAALTALPCAEDLAMLEDGGVIGAAAGRLREQAVGATPQDRADAALALRLLWAEQQRLGTP